MPDPSQVPGNALVHKTTKTQVGSQWPLPVHQRMLDILAIAEQLGHRTSKAEVIAALTCAFEPTEQSLDALLKGYRRLRAGEVVLGQSADADVIQISRLSPGRPRDGASEQ